MIGLFLIGSLMTGCATSSVDRSVCSPISGDESRGRAAPTVLHTGAETAEYSYATGCYQAYQRICQKLLTDDQRAVCRDDGLAQCEKHAHAFGDWIRSGNPR